MVDRSEPLRKLPFSQRFGFAPPPTPLALNLVSEILWTDLFNTIVLTCSMGDDKHGENLALDIWMHFLHMPLEQIPRSQSYRVISFGDVVRYVRDIQPPAPDLRVYDLLEFVCSAPHTHSLLQQLHTLANQDFERDFAAVRLIDGLVTPITDEQQRATIEIAMQTPLAGVRTQLHNSLDLMSDHDDPKYGDSIKNSIGAVETLCRKITGENKATLGQALKRIKDTGMQLHPSLERAFGHLYGYTSDESGVRHALMDEGHLELEDARYMLVTCSAFVNYLVVKADKAGIQL